MNEAIQSRAAIALAAQRAFKEQGEHATNPHSPLDDAHQVWAVAFDRARTSDVLEGSES
jgi:hypothetical protein